jgi:hypothetical protein
MADEDRQQDHQSEVHVMEHDVVVPGPLLCPSAQPEMTDSVVFGVIGGTVEEPRLAYLTEPHPVTDELFALSGPVNPTEIFRFAAPCAAHACQHFDGSNCRLATRIVQLLPVVVERLPSCRLRPKCRWWQQEGKAACMRCPQVVTEDYRPSELTRQAADCSLPAKSLTHSNY